MGGSQRVASASLLSAAICQSRERFLGMDVLVSAVAVMVFVRGEGSRLTGATRWLPLVALLGVGVSLALPLFLYLRERQLGSPAELPA